MPEEYKTTAAVAGVEERKGRARGTESQAARAATPAFCLLMRPARFLVL